MYQIALCDDETEEIQKTENMLVNYQKKHPLMDFVIKRFESTDKLLCKAEEEGYMPDLILMDIYMPGQTGTEAVKKLRDIGNKSRIIFLTTSKEHALDAFGVGAFQYFVKPVQEETLFKALDQILEDMPGKKTKYILLKTDGRIQRVPVEDIVYCEAQRKTQHLYLSDGTKFLLHMTIAEIYGMLSCYPEFVRVGVAYIVNLGFIDSLNAQYIEFNTGKGIYLPRGAYKTLKEQYFEYYCGPGGSRI